MRREARCERLGQKAEDGEREDSHTREIQASRARRMHTPNKPQTESEAQKAEEKAERAPWPNILVDLLPQQAPAICRPPPFSQLS